MAEGLAVFSQADVQRLSDTVRAVEAQLRELRNIPRQQLPEGGGGLLLGLLKEDLAAGGEAKGVFLVDSGSGTLVPETSDPAKYRTFVDRLEGITADEGRRCYLSPDVLSGGKWMVVQTVFVCDEAPPEDP
jgi:hypothetical protein